LALYLFIFATDTIKNLKLYIMKTTNSLRLISIRNLMGLVVLVTAMLLSSCEGPVGPPGEDGETIIGTVFDIQGNFNADNDYTLYTTYPSNLIVYDSDVVLVYILWEVADGMDVWRLCPQTVVLDNGVIQYNYDYTYSDVQIYLEFTIPENELLSSETDNQVFRIAVLPADFAADKSIDINDFSSLMEVPQLKLNTLDKINLDTTFELK